MARSSLALAAAMLAMLGAPGTSPASSTRARRAGCAAAAHGPGHARHRTHRARRPRRGTRGARRGTLISQHRHCLSRYRHTVPTRHTLPPRRTGSTGRLLFTAHHGRCKDSGLSPSPADLQAIRAATLCLVNRERAAHGEAALHWNDHLVEAAQAHTVSMAFGGYFEHAGPGGETPSDRMRRDGYLYSSRLGYEVGENIGWGSLWLGSPRAVVAAWMASPGHRANILDGRFRDTGIGVCAHLGSLANGRRGGIYTQDFGVITAG